MVLRSKLENQTRYTLEYSKIYESYEKKNAASFYKSFDVFLCHSSKDIKEILQIKAYLKKVYNQEAYVAEVDDPQLNPAKANKATAEVLKKRMENSSKLYFVLSKYSQRSTWMPWELGYFNGIKKDDNKIKVLPIVDNYDSEANQFEGHEYLELYDKISI